MLAATPVSSRGSTTWRTRLEPGSVIYLRSADGSIDGAYEVVTVDSAEQLCVSVLRGDSQDNPIALPAGSTSSPQAEPQATGIFYRISTLRPQIEEVSLRLAECFEEHPAARIGTKGRELEIAGLEDVSTREDDHALDDVL